MKREVEQVSLSDLGICYGKTFRAHSQATVVTTSGASSKKQQGSLKRMPLFLDLRRGGRWSNGGCIVGNGWSLAWKLHDAQFWGVAQRRKRIALVADFGGYTAPEILFIPKGVFGDIEQSEEAGQGTAKNSEDGVGEAISFQERAGKPGGGKGIPIQNERVGALSTLNNQMVLDSKTDVVAIEGNGARPSHQGDGYKEGDTMYTLNSTEQHAVAYGISSFDSNAMKSANPHSGIYEADTSRTLDVSGGNPACNQGGIAVVYRGDSITNPINASNPKPGDPCHTLTDDSRNHLVSAGFCTEHSADARGIGYEVEKAPTFRAGTVPAAIAIENHPNDSRVKLSEDGVVQTLSGRMGTGGGNVPLVMETHENAD